MNVLPLATILGIFVASVLVAGCSVPATTTETADMNVAATAITTSVNTGLYDIRAGLANTSRTLAGTGLSGRHAEGALSENLQQYSYALSSWTISPDGIVLAAVPEKYAGFVGTNVSSQVHVQTANTRQASTVSGVTPLAEGFNAIVQTYPVFSESGEYLGYVDITYKPEIFLRQYIEPVTNGTPYDVWVIQSDGTEIYDTTPAEIGKNILTDSIYADPAMQEIVNRIVHEPSATGRYTFWDREWSRNVTKVAVWETAGIDGAAWRVGVTREE
jgi:hypothetical protein